MNRPFTLFMLLCSLLSYAAFTPAALAQSSFVYDGELGGWLDTETGLVWGEMPDKYLHFINPSYPGGGPFSWNYTVNTLLPEYKLYTGFNDWRLPTRTEASTAAAHGLIETFELVDPEHIAWMIRDGRIWTSEASGKSAYYVFVANGQVGSFLKTVGIYPGAVFVRNSVPVSSGPGKKGK